MRQKEESIPKLYGLGTFEQSLVTEINQAVLFLLDGVPEEQQVGIIDQLNEGGLNFDLQ